MVVTVLVVVLALVLGWVGWRVLRNRRRGAAPAVAGPAPLPPSADDDPLSREANEWERYARELAAAGRAREAIRAWYHAVLVALLPRRDAPLPQGAHELGVRLGRAARHRRGAPASSR